jgi:hypothetical protein
MVRPGEHRAGSRAPDGCTAEACRCFGQAAGKQLRGGSQALRDPDTSLGSAASRPRWPFPSGQRRAEDLGHAPLGGAAACARDKARAALAQGCRGVGGGCCGRHGRCRCARPAEAGHQDAAGVGRPARRGTGRGRVAACPQDAWRQWPHRRQPEWRQCSIDADRRRQRGIDAIRPGGRRDQVASTP